MYLGKTIDERQKDKKNKLQRGGIEPPTSAVLKPRHNQLDHLCLSPVVGVIAVHNGCCIVSKIAPKIAPNAANAATRSKAQT